MKSKLSGGLDNALCTLLLVMWHLGNSTCGGLTWEFNCGVGICKVRLGCFSVEPKNSPHYGTGFRGY